MFPHFPRHTRGSKQCPSVCHAPPLCAPYLQASRLPQAAGADGLAVPYVKEKGYVPTPKPKPSPTPPPSPPPPTPPPSPPPPSQDSDPSPGPPPSPPPSSGPNEANKNVHGIKPVMLDANAVSAETPIIFENSGRHAGNPMIYHGGPVITTPVIYIIWSVHALRILAALLLHREC